jgi:hypothetical protein
LVLVCAFATLFCGALLHLEIHALYKRFFWTKEQKAEVQKKIDQEKVRDAEINERYSERVCDDECDRQFGKMFREARGNKEMNELSTLLCAEWNANVWAAAASDKAAVSEAAAAKCLVEVSAVYEETKKAV